MTVFIMLVLHATSWPLCSSVLGAYPLFHSDAVQNMAYQYRIGSSSMLEYVKMKMKIKVLLIIFAAFSAELASLQNSNFHYYYYYLDEMNV
jgi:hypothetical protein